MRRVLGIARCEPCVVGLAHHLWSLTGSGHNIEMVIPEGKGADVGTFDLAARESVVYSACGIPQAINASDFDGNGTIDPQGLFAVVNFMSAVISMCQNRFGRGR